MGPAARLGGGNATERAALHDRDPAARRLASGAARARARGRPRRASLADLRKPRHASRCSSTRPARIERCLAAGPRLRVRPGLGGADRTARARPQRTTKCAEALLALSRWLADEQDEPGDWPGHRCARAGARSRKSRHGAILLPFRALLAAIEVGAVTTPAETAAGDDRDPRKRRDHARRRAGLRHPVPPAEARRDPRLHRRRRADRPAGPAA